MRCKAQADRWRLEAFAQAIRHLFSYTRQPSERDATAVRAIADRAKVGSQRELSKRRKFVQ